MIISALKNYVWRIWVGVFAIFLFAIWAFYSYDFKSVFFSISKSNLKLITVAVALNILLLYFRVVKWRLFFVHRKKISFYNMSLAAFSAYTLNMVFPARLGLFLQSWILSKKESIPNSSTLGTVLLTRILDGITIAIIALFTLVMEKKDSAMDQPSGEQFGPLYNAAIIFFSVYLSVTLFLFIISKHDILFLKVLAFLKRFTPKRFEKNFEEMIVSFREGMAVVQNTGQFLIILLLTFIFWYLCSVWIVVMLKAFAVDTPGFLISFVVLTFQIFGFAIPVPGNIGPYHVATVTALSIYGITGEYALSIAIVMHAAIFITNTLPGIFYMLYERFTNPGFAQKLKEISTSDFNSHSNPGVKKVGQNK